MAYAETPRRFQVRNPFASGGVYEDPATGAAAAAFAGYLRAIGWPHGGSIEIVQGEDMGMRGHACGRISQRWPAPRSACPARARLMTG
ncbi:MAG: PhzF family phenazine biosynthesis protein [Acetobacteraceae bacterium]